MWYTDDNYMDREVCPMREIKDTENRRPLPDAEADGIIEGRNAVIEALRAGRTMRYRDGALEEVSGAC